MTSFTLLLSNRFNSPPVPYGFDNNSRKSDILDDSMLAHVAQNSCGREVNNVSDQSRSLLRSLLILQRNLWLYF